jgi:hypothetical protein
VLLFCSDQLRLHWVAKQQELIKVL